MMAANPPGDPSTRVVRREVCIGMPEGLHARPSTLLSQAAGRYHGDVRILANGQTADAKSIFDLLSLGLMQGTRLTIEVEGPDAGETLDSLCNLFDTNFAES